MGDGLKRAHNAALATQGKPPRFKKVAKADAQRKKQLTAGNPNCVHDWQHQIGVEEVGETYWQCSICRKISAAEDPRDAAQ